MEIVLGNRTNFYKDAISFLFKVKSYSHLD